VDKSVAIWHGVKIRDAIAKRSRGEIGPRTKIHCETAGRGEEGEEEEGDGGRDAGQVAWQKGVDGDSTPPSDLLPVCPFRSRDSTCRSYVETHRLGDGQVYLYAELRRTLCLFY